MSRLLGARLRPSSLMLLRLRLYHSRVQAPLCDRYLRSKLGQHVQRELKAAFSGSSLADLHFEAAHSLEKAVEPGLHPIPARSRFSKARDLDRCSLILLSRVQAEPS